MAKKRTSKKSTSKLSPELRLAGGIIIVLLILFAHDYILNPQATVKTLAQTAQAVADVPVNVVYIADDVQRIAASEPAPTPIPDNTVRILSPAPGSTHSGGFTLKVQVPAAAKMCYYQIKDATTGVTTWDRRTRQCGQDIVIRPEWCPTSGTNTCFVLYSADSDLGGTNLGTAEAYFSIK